MVLRKMKRGRMGSLGEQALSRWMRRDSARPDWGLKQHSLARARDVGKAAVFERVEL